MQVSEIVYVVFVVVGIICYVVSTALAIKRKKSSGTVTEQEANDEFAQLILSTIDQMVSAEATYENVFKTDIKAGTFKLKDVLETVKEYCTTNGITYDKDYWTELIEKVVNFRNLDTEVQSNGQKPTTQIN